MRTLILVLFTVCILIAAALVFIDPLTGEGWHGVVSLLAAGALGFPWSLAMFFLIQYFPATDDKTFLFLLWICVFVNYALLVRAWRSVSK